mmetsp:Transcript_40891/g.108073  ORF Transcript_40891/g.108073 Transcript_40891/m.108073 type:complete len:273 (-) Transcript_40891:251-1069(-)
MLPCAALFTPPLPRVIAPRAALSSPATALAPILVVIPRLIFELDVDQGLVVHHYALVLLLGQDLLIQLRHLLEDVERLLVGGSRQWRGAPLPLPPLRIVVPSGRSDRVLAAGPLALLAPALLVLQDDLVHVLDRLPEAVLADLVATPVLALEVRRCPIGDSALAELEHASLRPPEAGPGLAVVLDDGVAEACLHAGKRLHGGLGAGKDAGDAVLLYPLQHLEDGQALGREDVFQVAPRQPLHASDEEGVRPGLAFLLLHVLAWRQGPLHLAR